MHFAEPEKAKKDSQAFADTNDHRLFKLLNACANPESDLRTIIKAKVRPFVLLREPCSDRRTSWHDESSSPTRSSSIASMF